MHDVFENAQKHKPGTKWDTNNVLGRGQTVKHFAQF